MRKIRLVITCISLVLLVTTMVLLTPLQAATNVILSGSNSLESIAAAYENGVKELTNTGFRPTGANQNTAITLAEQRRAGSEGNYTYQGNDAQTCRDNAISTGILSFAVYEKINCQPNTGTTDNHTSIYQFEVVLDFSSISIIHAYANRCIRYYNDIVFANVNNADGTSSAYEVPNTKITYRNYYTGAPLSGNFITTLSTDDSGNRVINVTKDGNPITCVLTYRIIFNTMSNIDTKNSGVTGSSFDFEDTTTNLPTLITLDTSKANISLNKDDTGAVVSTNGFFFADNADGDYDKYLSNVHHIHFVGKGSEQINVLTYIAYKHFDYTNYRTTFPESIYDKNGYGHTLIGKLEYDKANRITTFNVIDTEVLTSTDSVASRIVNLCSWINGLNITQTVSILHSRITKDAEGNTIVGTGLVITYSVDATDSTKYNVYEDGALIGSFTV